MNKSQRLRSKGQRRPKAQRLRSKGQRRRTCGRSFTRNRYTGKFGDGCGINSVIDGKSSDTACYKPCDLTEKSSDLYCQHVGFSAGGQYTYQSKDGSTHYRPRDFVPRKGNGTDAEKSANVAYETEFENLAKSNGWKEYKTTNMNTNIDLTKVAKNVAKGISAAAVGAVGLLADAAACGSSYGTACNLTTALMKSANVSYDNVSVTRKETASLAQPPAHPPKASVSTPVPDPVPAAVPNPVPANTEKRNAYCRANPNDKKVPKGGKSCADYCATADPNCIAPKLKK